MFCFFEEYCSMPDKFKIIAGPCLAESREIVMESAECLSEAVAGLPVDFYFKASYRKANRTSFSSFTGVGDEAALSWIREAGEKFGLKTLTDIHEPDSAALCADYVDVLQIPAFLSRQTDLIVAAARTGKSVNIKKAQFMAPEDALKAAEKAKCSGAKDIWLTERGTFFGYHDLVVDMRGMATLKKHDYPVIFDATHSVQQPSAGEQSGGLPDFIPALTRAALAIGIDGVFFETHPEPARAMSDASTQLELSRAADFIKMIYKLNKYIKSEVV